MARKKGELEQTATAEVKEDLLDTVFGASKSEQKPKSERDTSPPPPAKAAGTAKDKRVGKYFLIDRDLAKAMKLFAVQNDMKEIAVIEASLRAYLGFGDKPKA